ncbi:protein phosphatase 1 regulatory subunit 12A isoform X17 [Anopheles stephensi]|uniref:protein phosphatase 1 regulatory subunit 12A isoform X17 n=1 Tax=Anopheles stephensi TaxID=30069 RepID=UPI0007D3FECD|nr:protein phosphatase 1 regulatory subunit 12A isoform X17 [Anopheles stephensi]
MSFRSRSRTVQPIVTRRASSLTRTIAPSSVNGVSGASSLASSYAGRSYTGPSGITGSSYGSSGSPLATNSYSASSSPYGTTVSTSSPSSRSLLSNGGTNGTYFDYSNLSRRDSYGGSSSSLAYKSPYKDKDRYGANSSTGYTTSAGSSGTSYKDRYVSPYTSYDNGITTASLSLSGLKRHHHLSSNGLSGSNTSLNNSYTPSYGSSLHAGSHHHSTGVGRSQSLRDHERRSRSRTRASQAASSAAAMSSYPSNSSLSRSYSTASIQSEGYETGSERGRSRVGSTASELDTANQPQDSTRENGGDCIDYKALYEQEKADNDKLKMSLRKKDEEVVTLKAALDRFTTATTKNNSLSELEKRERRAMERKMSEMEEELKLLQKYKTENERLRAENRALTRVVSKLTTSAQNQVHAAAANKQ